MSKIARINAKIFCEICGLEVELTNYRLHCRTAHKKQGQTLKKSAKKEFICQICNKSHSSKFNLNYHLAHHYNLKNFLCDICPNAYNTKSDLNQHKKSHENKSGAFICMDCGELFETQHNLQIHLKSRHGKALNNSIECSVCTRSFSSAWHLEEHMKKHLREKNPKKFECTECEKVFKQKNSLKEHIDTIHRGLKKHKCIVCGKAFGSQRDRRKHELIHERGRNKTYCTYCKKYVSGDIVHHDQAVHTDSLYDCTICKRKFPSSHDLQRHHSLKHSQRQYICDKCGNSYSDLYYLRIHIITHTIAKESSNPKTDLDRNYCCHICKKKFSLPRTLARHILIHENIKQISKKENYCKFCRIQVSDMKEHNNNIHSDMKFQCNECSTRFKSQSSLNYHKKTKHLKSIEDSVEIKINVSDFISDDLENIKLEQIDQLMSEDFVDLEQKVKIEPMEFQLCSSDDIKLKEDEISLEHDIHEDINCDESEKFSASEDDSILVRNEVKGKNRRSDSNIPLEKDGKKLRVTCRVCCATFNTINAYQDHFLMNHVNEEVEHKCKACDLFFEDRKKLQAHIRETHEIFKCDNCRRQFTSQFLLDEHKYEHEIKDRLMCMHCGKLYANRVSLKAHTEAHHSNKRFKCDECDKSYSFKAALYKHRQWVHQEEKKHKCSECKYMARTKYEVKLHYDHHHTFQRANANEKYYCNICGITFPNSSTLSRHMLIQHDGFTYTVNKKCIFCKEPVKNNYQAVKHMAQVHLDGERKLRQCGFCKIEIELFDDYINHISTHPDILICQICGDPFLTELMLQNHLDNHKQLEKDLRKYVCDYCGQKKNNRAQIEAHMITHHAKFPTLHRCKICGKGFKLASVLYTHMKYHLGGSKSCSYCEKKFVTNTELANHVRINHTHEKPFKCYVCNLAFYTKPLLKDHYQSHPQTMMSYDCKMCNITFGKNKKEKDIHDGAFHPELRPFRCMTCNMTFTYEHHLNKHELKHIRKC